MELVVLFVSFCTVGLHIFQNINAVNKYYGRAFVTSVLISGFTLTNLVLVLGNPKEFAFYYIAGCSLGAVAGMKLDDIINHLNGKQNGQEK